MRYRQPISVLVVSTLLVTLVSGLAWGAKRPLARISGSADAMWVQKKEKFKKLGMGSFGFLRYFPQNKKADRLMVVAVARAKLTITPAAASSDNPAGSLGFDDHPYDITKRAPNNLQNHKLDVFIGTQAGEGESWKYNLKEERREIDGQSFNFAFREVDSFTNWNNWKQFENFDGKGGRGHQGLQGTHARLGGGTLGANQAFVQGLFYKGFEQSAVWSKAALAEEIATLMSQELDKVAAAEVARRRNQEPPRP